MFDDIEYDHQAPATTLGFKVPTESENIVQALLSADIPFDAPVKVPMASILPDGGVRVIPGKYNLMDSRGRIVGENVTDRYTPIGFGEMFGVIDHLLQEGFSLDRAIEFNGRRLFVSVELTDYQFDVTGDGDLVTPYVWTRGSHDSSSSTEVFVALGRGYCTNQLVATRQMVKRMGLPHTSIRHTRSAPERLRMAEDLFRNCERMIMTQKAIMKTLADTPFSAMDFADFMDNLLPLPEVPLEGEPTRGYTLAENRRELLFDLYEHGRGAHSGRGSKWQALNAVTEYSTHHIPTRGGDREEKLFLGSVEGPAAKLNERAMALLTA